MRWPLLMSVWILAIGFLHAQNAKDALGDPLPAGSIVRFGTERFRLTDSTTPAILTPEGNAFFATDRGGMGIFDVKTGKATGKLKGEANIVPAVVSADGKRAAFSRYDSVAVADLKTGKKLGEVKKKFYLSEGLIALSADGSRLAVGGAADEKAKEKGVVVTVAEFAEESKEPVSIKIAQNSSGRVALSGDGKILATFGYHTAVSRAGETPDPDENPSLFIQYWDSNTGKEIAKSKMEVNPVAVALNPDGTLAAASSGNGLVAVFDTKTGKPLKQLLGRSRVGRLLLFSADGAALAATSEDGAIQIWDVVKGESLGVTDCPIAGQYNPIRSMVFPAKDRLVAMLTKGVATVIWEAPSGKTLSVDAGSHESLTSVAFAKDDAEVIVGSYGAAPIRFGLDGKQLGTLALKIPGANWPGYPPGSGLAITPDGKTAYRTESSELSVYDLGTGLQKCAVPASYGYGPNIAFSGDGKWIAFASQMPYSLKPKPGKITVADVEKKMIATTVPLPDGVPSSFAFSGKAKHVGTMARVQKGKDPASLILYGIDLGTGKVVSENKFAENYGLIYMTGVPGTDSILVAHPATGLLEIDLNTGKTARTFVKGPTATLTGPPVFSPDGKSVAYPSGVQYGSGPAEIQIRDWESAKVLHKFTGHSRAATALAFSKSGRMLASASTDSTALIWDLSSPKE